jgi:hypothetical protein
VRIVDRCVTAALTEAEQLAGDAQPVRTILFPLLGTAVDRWWDVLVFAVPEAFVLGMAILLAAAGVTAVVPLGLTALAVLQRRPRRSGPGPVLVRLSTQRRSVPPGTDAAYPARGIAVILFGGLAWLFGGGRVVAQAGVRMR